MRKMIPVGENMGNTDQDRSKEWEIGARGIGKSHGFIDQNEDHAKARIMAERTADLALQIPRLSRNKLLVNLRFMEAAFVRLSSSESFETLETATDGQFLYYNSVHVCRQYRRDVNIPVRDYLHVTLHCLFRHLFVGKAIRRDLWDLACDIAVENIIGELSIRSLYTERQESQGWLIKKLKEEIPRLTAERIYHYFDQVDPSPEEVQRLAEAFHADDHRMWYAKATYEKSGKDSEDTDKGDPEDDEGEKTKTDADAVEEGLPEEDEGEGTDTDNMLDAIDGGSEDGIGKGGDENSSIDNEKPALTPEELEQEWREISERIQVDIDTHSESWGEGTGGMQQTLQEINREKYDYIKLLKRFSVIGENIEINDDEFDYIFYTYGMQLYKNVPLVEPLEYKDVKKIKEFVIALDTSESVSGETVQKFVTKTWNILKQRENFFSRVNIHIIQCGARVEEDVRINTQDEFDLYIKNMVLKGFGGTDFRPVFEHVDSLIRQHEFTNLKGLIYFTDGYGTFPGNPPDYDAAFVFLDQGYELPDIPVWAIKMLLTEDEIQEF